MPKRRHALLILLLLALAALASIAASLSVGSVRLGPSELLQALSGQDRGIAFEVVRSLRLPRALAGFACGGLLALAGALMQVLLKNPLADPYVLGVSGGASVGALFALLFGLPLLVLHLGAFAGALISMLLVFGLAHGDGSWTQTRLLLTGVVVAAGAGAVVALMLSVAPEQQLRGMLFWLMGDLSQAGSPWPALAVLALGLALVLPFARDLGLLARGELPAQALGVPVARLRLMIYVLASLFTATAVNSAGSIGFVGLIVPHLVRLALRSSAGNDQRLLLPASVLAGGTLLVVADALARTLVAPQQLPVGVLTALIGVPAFLYLLSRQPR
ncbi:MAG TPA: iron ABC transporter permease [Rhodocyclaceae bacterium]|nr:iron ABC transporter permease [Rhodocyclaceae bacterium]